MSTMEFSTTVRGASDGRAYLELPFDPDLTWGTKNRHHVRGWVSGRDFRGPLERYDTEWRLLLGPAWRRDCGIKIGDSVTVILMPEGPQWDSLPADLAEALEAEPQARAFFESLATFYRKGYLRWLEGSARRPEVRRERIREWIDLLKAGKKSRP